MPVTNCRICNHPFFAEPLLRYDNMPRAAQNLPTAAMLAEEHGGSLEICQCSGCGLVQLGNDPVSYYREVIRASAFSEEMREFRMRQFNDFVRNFKLKGKKVLEFGCGRGEYLSLMKQAGADAYGLEYADDAVRECCNSGLNVTKGFMDSSDLVLNGMPFDAFFIMNFLEHLPDPNVALSGICSNLTVDGIGLIEVPNFDMILNRSLFSEFTGDHLFYFTRDTLATALQLNGFEVLSCDEIWHDYILSAVVIKREKTDVSRFHQQQSGLKAAIADYIGQFGAGRTAIWGAGHQALAVMALAGLEGKIKYVIDSAPFKQGRYTPATHIPIVAPEILYSEPPDAIIVMAAAYSDEVARIIRHKFDKNIRVVILRGHGLESVK